MTKLLAEIDAFLTEFGMSDFRFGLLACRNGRLVERLRQGRRVWPETEAQIRAFMIERRRANKAAEPAQ